MDEMYQKIAELAAKRIDALFESEDTLQAAFATLFPQLVFSRTDHWSSILHRVVRDCWLEAGPEVKSEPTSFDKAAILQCLHSLLDYNLFTQVMLNLQPLAVMAYQARDAQADIEKLQEEWPKDSRLNPFESKARMIKASHITTEADTKYNHALSTIRSLKIIASFTPQISFRVSPKGSTPALTDSNNISNLGIGGDKYLRVMPSLKAWYIHWIPGTSPFMGVTFPDGSIGVDGIPYKFHSKSGGEVLHQVLFSRKIAYEVFGAHDVTNETCVIIPRMNSVLVICDEAGMSLKQVFYSLRSKYAIELAEGNRVDTPTND